MPSLMQNLSYAVAFACALLAVHMARAPSANRQASLLLTAMFTVFAVQAVLLAVLLDGAAAGFARILRPSLAMTIGPLVFLFFTSAANPDFRFRPIHLLHFIPAAVIAAELWARIYWIDIDLAIFASFGAYAAAVTLMASRGADQFAHLGARKMDAYRWLVVSAALLAVSFVSEIIIYVDILRGASLARSGAMLGVQTGNLAVVGIAVSAALRRPSGFDWLYAFEGALSRTGAQTYSQQDYEECIRRFERLIAAERLYAEEGVTLRAAARRIGAPARQLSEAVNRTYGESFSRRMNRLRVEEAKRILREHPERTMTEIMFDAGFRTKSSFNKEFLAIEGVSPTAFRNAAASESV